MPQWGWMIRKPKFDVSEKANTPSAGGGVNGAVTSLDYTVGLASSAGGSGLM